MAFAMEELGQEARADAHRASALSLGVPKLKAPVSSGTSDTVDSVDAMDTADAADTGQELLRRAVELAWDTRLVGVELIDESLEPEVLP